MDIFRSSITARTRKNGEIKIKLVTVRIEKPAKLTRKDTCMQATVVSEAARNTAAPHKNRDTALKKNLLICAPYRHPAQETKSRINISKQKFRTAQINNSAVWRLIQSNKATKLAPETG